MTDFIIRTSVSTLLWWPVIFRGGLYVTIATLTAALSEFDTITPDVLASMNWIDWTKSTLTILIVGLTTLRTFVDQSVSQHADKLNENPNPTTELVRPTIP